MMMGRAVATRRLLALSGSLLLLGLVGCSASAPLALPTAEITASATAIPTPAAVPAPTPAVSVPVRDAALGSAQPAEVPPVGIRVAAIELDMSIEPVGVDDDGLMELPPDTAVAGWYRFGPGPRAVAGSTVVAAHVDSNAYGLGPFARLRELVAGTDIEVTTADGSIVRYAVSSVTTTVKGEVPLDTVFDRSGPARLTLVTCGGDFDYDTRHYLSNVIVEAVPLP
ncbi:class F sortase [Microbacteriaceae bacterium VKM Ac-2855]|nr:class F sortase [Microbacteriaceae bacterium VKM Ac-2855]